MHSTTPWLWLVCFGITTLCSPISIPRAVASPAYPLAVGGNGRYLVDQTNTPFLIVGDSPQALLVNLTEAQAAAYFADRAAHGFNAVWINLLCGTYTGGRADGSTIDGTIPFTTPGDLATPNEAYFSHVDRVLALAAQYGLLVLLDPAETGSWLGVLRANGAAKARVYGQYLGTRYQHFTNLLWMSGNDFQSWRASDDDAVVQAVAGGIHDTAPGHLQTVELDYNVSTSLDDPAWAPLIQLNAAYTYYPTYAEVLHGYNHTPAVPVFMVEANYEFENNTGNDYGSPQLLRRQEYWTLLSGATGQLYGNHYTCFLPSNWSSYLDTPGVQQLQYATALFQSLPWYALVPDQAHAVVTAGYGTFATTGSVGGNDYAPAARTPDGTLVLAYLPTLRTLTLNLAALSGPATARWFDPTTGDYTPIPGPAGGLFQNTGLQRFTPPGINAAGDGDWLLILATGLTVSSVTPNTGPIAGDTLVTLTGTDFVAGATVSFGGAAATGVSVLSATTLLATTPAHAAGAVPVVVTNPGGQSGTLAAGFTYGGATAPTLGSVAPNTGPITGGTAVTLTGTNFATGVTVTFGGTSATNVSLASPTTLTATTPAHAAGSVAVVVTNPDGQTGMLTAGFTYATSTAPTLSSVTPASGPLDGGTPVTLTGTNFVAGMTVTFGGIPATNVGVPNATTLTAATPAHAAGAVPVVVTNPGGQSGTLAAGFNYTGTAAISFVQVAAATPQAPTQTVRVTYPRAQTAGDLNLVVVGWNDTTATVQSVTDTRGNVYSVAIGPTSGVGLRQSIYYATGIGGGATTVTVTFTRPAVYPDIRILEYAGVSTLDKTAGASGNSASTNTGTVTLSAAKELLVGANMVATATKSPGTSFTSRTITTPDGDIVEDRIVTAIGAYSATAPLSSAGAWVMQLVTFK